jgi:hypothetical protein
LVGQATSDPAEDGKSDVPALTFAIECVEAENSTKMATQTPRSMPEELILNILECACASIVQDLTVTIPSPAPFSTQVNHFLQLRLVCKAFNRILTHCIRVKGEPIEQWLPDLQVKKLHNLKDKTTIQAIHRGCGNVWYNPGFYDSFRNGFWGPGSFCRPGISRDVIMWLLYRAPELFKERLTVNEEYSGPKNGRAIYTNPTVTCGLLL